MSVAAKQVLLEDGGSGTTPFVVEAEQRAIYGYPVIMAQRSTLMAATDWTAQTADVAAEPHHLLADQHLTDEQWKLFQCLWLYAHSVDHAFDGVTVSDEAAEQLRAYLGIDDCSEFRLATGQPLVIDQEISRAAAILRPVIDRVVGLHGDAQFNAATQLDGALQQRVLSLHDRLKDDVSYVTRLTYPLIDTVSFSDSNYLGEVAMLIPPHIRDWINLHGVGWKHSHGNVIRLTCQGIDQEIKTTNKERLAPGQFVFEALLVPASMLVHNVGEHVVSGLARGMLNTVSYDQSTLTHAIVAPQTAEVEWTHLLQQYENTPMVLVAELLHEAVRLGLKLGFCEQLTFLLKQIQRENRVLLVNKSTTDLDRRLAQIQLKHQQQADKWLHAINND